MNHATTANAGLGGRLESPGECRGYEVRDPLGQRLWLAEDLFVNADGGPEYVRVSIGFLRTRSVLIPVQGAEVDTERRTIVLW